MHTEYLVVNDSRGWEAVEHVAELLPQFDGVPAFRLVVEAVYPVNPRALVITPEAEEVLRILKFMC